MSNLQTNKPKRESRASYIARIAPLKQNIIAIGEKNMENTLWVIRRWLRDEMDLINTPKGAQKAKN